MTGSKWPRPGERQFRIRTDRYAGFEWQTRTFWWPFWHMGHPNTALTIEGAAKSAMRWLEDKRKAGRKIRLVRAWSVSTAGMEGEG